MTPTTNEDERKKTKNCLRIATIVYLLLFPFLFVFAVASIMVFDSPSISIPIGLLNIFIYFWMPLSIPLALYLMWSRYLRSDYKTSRQYGWLPIYVIGGIISLFAVMDTITILLQG